MALLDEAEIKAKIQKSLEYLARRYLKQTKPKLVVITGSVGKTSTKNAIATVLHERYKVRVNVGSHNTHLSVPLAVMGVAYPRNIRSPLEWARVFIHSLIKAFGRKDVEVIVQELGTDQPGDIAQFGTYLNPDIAVVTAVAPEPMEFMGSLTVVAQEELAVAKFSKLTIVNRDDVDEQYAKFADTHTIDTYGLSGVAEYHFIIQDTDMLGDGYKGVFVCPEFGEIPATVKVVGEHSIKAAVAAGTVGVKLELEKEEIARGLSKVRPVPGRMQVLRGLENSILIDDTYNSSPVAAKAALQTLYQIPASNRIVILGSMNELGGMSKQAHEEVGKACDPALLSWVITIGKEAAENLAPAAIEKGCQVKSFLNPYEAGAFAHQVLEPNSVVLAKGSQNGVFAEESLKILLHSTKDNQKLVRQSQFWLEIKQKQFYG